MSWMGQKSEPEPARPPRPPAATAAPTAHPAAAAATPNPSREAPARAEASVVAHVGRSVQIKGELSGDEDLIIDGRVDGKIVLNGHRAVIGQHGRVTAEVFAQTVIVNGGVEGNITANQRVEIAATGAMVGDIRAPRVVLADGARFRGRIEMDAKAGHHDARPASTGRPVGAGDPLAGDVGVTVDIADT